MNIVEKLKNKKKEYENIINDLDEILREVEEEEYSREKDNILKSIKNIETIIFNIKTKLNSLSKIIIKENKDILKSSDNIEKYKMLIKFNPEKYFEKIKKDSINNEKILFLLGEIYLNGIIYNNKILYKDLILAKKTFYKLYSEYNIIDAGYLLGITFLQLNEIENAINIFEVLGAKDHLKSLQELLIIYEKNIKYKNKTKYLDIYQKIFYHQNNY